MVSGLVLQAVGMAWLALIAEVGMACSQVLAPFVVADVGVSMAIPAAQNSAVGSAAVEAVGAFLAASPMSGGVCWRVMPTRANRQLAFAHYRFDADAAAYRLGELCVLMLEGDRIKEITAFRDREGRPAWSPGVRF
jgi:hypothetical protein